MDTKNNAMHVNPKHKWCMKKKLVKNLKLENFSVSINRVPIELGRKLCFQNMKFFTDRKSHSIDQNSRKLKNFCKINSKQEFSCM